MYSRLNQLPPARQEVVRKSINKFSQEPADRQQAMREELRGLGALPEPARQARLSSPEFRSKFSGKEQEIVRDMADLLPPGSE
jgi:Arc/MetJ-type ribon-helix-helix transcriptional regulator